MNNINNNKRLRLKNKKNSKDNNTSTSIEKINTSIKDKESNNNIKDSNSINNIDKDNNIEKDNNNIKDTNISNDQTNADNMQNTNKRTADNMTAYEIYMAFGAYYMQTGDHEQTFRAMECESKLTQKSLIQKYQELNLPQPTQADERLLAQLEQTLPISELVQIIADSARQATNNQIADKILLLYLERERTRKLEKYSQMSVEQRFDWVIQDTEFLNALEKSIAVEHIDERLSTNLSYWQRYANIYGNEALLEVKSLIDKIVIIPENVDKREFD